MPLAPLAPREFERVPKPLWIKVRPPGGANFHRIKGLLRDLNLHTVCEEARCPNISECWAGGTATFMLMGDLCTRGCKFCAVKTGNPKGLLDHDEPGNIARAIGQLGLDYVVLTSVNRDDLADGGADHFARTVENLKRDFPELLVETLIPDFDTAGLTRLVMAKPDVVAHNVETVERLQKTVRDPRAGYARSLAVLRGAKEIDPTRFTKSSIMMGLGETDAEVRQAMADLRAAGVDMLTLGQYLQPTLRHLPVQEFVHPDRFAALGQAGEAIGFRYVAAGPLVRSSYRAGEFFLRRLLRGNEPEERERPREVPDGPAGFAV